MLYSIGFCGLPGKQLQALSSARSGPAQRIDKSYNLTTINKRYADVWKYQA
jgi:hypothetical protein